MNKGSKTIEKEMYNALSEFFRGVINGHLYTSGQRVFNSETEDAVITVTKAISGQIQKGNALINVYVKDVDYGGGRYVPNDPRLRDLDALGDSVVCILNSADLDFSFELVSIDDIAMPDIRQWRKQLLLSFQRINFN